MSTDHDVTTPTFRDPDLERVFRRDGFVVVDLLDDRTVAELLEIYGELDSGITSGYYPSLASSDVEYKNAAHANVSRRVWPVLDGVLNDYEPLLGVFMVKHPGPDSDVPIHQDWNIADESRRPSMTAWMPLTQVDELAGEMRVLPGSHLWLEGLRGSPTFPTQWDGNYDRVRDELMETVHVDPGQALIYDIRLLHGTPINRSPEVRVVASLYSIPRGSAPVHYYRAPDGTVEGYHVPSNFCTVFHIGDVPEGDRFVEIPDYSVPLLTVEELAERYRRSPAFAARTRA